MTLFEFALLLCLIGFSGMLSSAETALFSLSRFQLRHLRENFQTSYFRVKKLLSDPGGLLFTLLVSNECANIAIATITGSALTRNWEETRSRLFGFVPEHWLTQAPPWLLQSIAGVIVTTPMILLLCEASPKAIGTRLNQLIAPLFSTPIYTLFRALSPAYKAWRTLASRISRKKKPVLSPSGDKDAPLLHEEEFLLMVEEGHKEGAIHESEVDLIRNVFELDDSSVMDIYTPLAKTEMLAASLSVREAIKALQGKKATRVAVYGLHRKDIVGILFTKDLIRYRLDPDLVDPGLRSLLHKPYLVPLTMRLNTLFRRMKQSKLHLAVVVDAKEEPVGIVTMNELLDEIFGDLFPEPALKGKVP